MPTGHNHNQLSLMGLRLRPSTKFVGLRLAGQTKIVEKPLRMTVKTQPFQSVTLGPKVALF
jgi:hypothetical protein